jgi:oligoribonuclease
VWLDLETTGLEADALILEIAMVVTDGELVPIACFASVVAWPSADVDSRLCDVTREMHTANGLLDDVLFAHNTPAHHWYTLPEVEQRAIDFLMIHTAGHGKPALCGSSVHNDRRWLDHSMPGLAAMFSHRICDASGIRIAAQSIGATDFGPSPTTHRAMADVHASIQLARVARDYGLGWRAVWLHVLASGRVLCRMAAAALPEGRLRRAVWRFAERIPK